MGSRGYNLVQSEKAEMCGCDPEGKLGGFRPPANPREPRVVNYVYIGGLGLRPVTYSSLGLGLVAHRNVTVSVLSMNFLR